MATQTRARLSEAKNTIRTAGFVCLGVSMVAALLGGHGAMPSWIFGILGFGISIALLPRRRAAAMGAAVFLACILLVFVALSMGTNEIGYVYAFMILGAPLGAATFLSIDAAAGSARLAKLGAALVATGPGAIMLPKLLGLERILPWGTTDGFLLFVLWGGVTLLLIALWQHARFLRASTVSGSTETLTPRPA